MEFMANEDDKADDETLTLPFPPRLVSLFRQLTDSTDASERYLLSREMAEVFAETHDPTDHGLTDDYHQYFEEFDKAKLAYDQAALKVARVATQVIEQYMVTKGVGPEDLCVETPNRSAN